jgi:DNA-binding transcriptional LysR family regulator
MAAKKESNFVQEASRIELQQLKYFVAVAEHLNFSKAADELFVTQPLLSQQIVALEQMLGCRLFLRSTKGVSLTPAGRLFLTEARRILDKADAAVRAAVRAASGDAYPRHIRVICDELYDRAAVTDGAFRFMQAHPDCMCEIKIRPYFSAIEMLERRQADLSIAFLDQPPDRKRIVQQILGEDCLDLVAPGDLAEEQTRDDLLRAAGRLPLLLPERDTRLLNTAVQVCEDLGLSPTTSFSQAAADVIMEVELGGAFTLLPHRFARRHQGRALVRLPLRDVPRAQLTCSAYWLGQGSNPVLPVLASYFSDAYAPVQAQ